MLLMTLSSYSARRSSFSAWVWWARQVVSSSLPASSRIAVSLLSPLLRCQSRQA